MTNRDLARGVFRAWGVMWSIYALVSAPQFVNALLRNPYGESQEAMRRFALSSSAISLGCEVAVAALLLVKAGWLAELVFPNAQEANFSIGAADLQAILFSAIGLYFLVDGLRLLVGNGFHLLAQPSGQFRTGLESLWRRAPEQLAAGFAEFIAGAVILLLRGRFRRPGKHLSEAYQRALGLKEPSE